MEVKVARLADLPPGKGMAVYAGGRDIALFNLAGEIKPADTTETPAV